MDLKDIKHEFDIKCEIKCQYMHVLFECIFPFLRGKSQQEISVNNVILKPAFPKNSPNTQDKIFKWAGLAYKDTGLIIFTSLKLGALQRTLDIIKVSKAWHFAMQHHCQHWLMIIVFYNLK